MAESIPLPLGINDGDPVDSTRLAPDTWDTVSAAFQLSAGQTTSVYVLKYLQMQNDQANWDHSMSVDELNQAYPDLKGVFTERTNDLVAATIAENQRKVRGLQEIISMGPQDYFAKTARLAVSLAPHIADPINLIVGAGIGGVLEGIGFVGSAALKSLVSSQAGREFISEATGAIAANALVEPISYFGHKQEKTDYSAAESLLNVIVGGLAFPAIKHAFVGSFRFLKGLGGKNLEIVNDTALGQFASDKKVDVEPLVHDIAGETTGKSDASPYFFEPKTAKDLNTAELYAGTARTSNPELRGDPIDLHIGDGVYASDNPHVANGIAARKLRYADGRVDQFKLKDAKLVDLEKPFSADQKAALDPVLKELLGPVADQITPETSAKEVLKLVQDTIQAKAPPAQAIEDIHSAFNQIKDTLQAHGVDGYHYQGGHALGVQGDPHNAVMLFDNKKIQDLKRFTPVADQVPQASNEQIKSNYEKAISETTDSLHDPKAIETLRQAIRAPEQDPQIQKIVQQTQDHLDAINELQKMDLLSPEEIKQVEELKGLSKELDQEDLLTKAAIVCLGRYS